MKDEEEPVGKQEEPVMSAEAGGGPKVEDAEGAQTFTMSSPSSETTIGTGAGDGGQAEAAASAEMVTEKPEPIADEGRGAGPEIEDVEGAQAIEMSSPSSQTPISLGAGEPTGDEYE